MHGVGRARQVRPMNSERARHDAWNRRVRVAWPAAARAPRGLRPRRPGCSLDRASPLQLGPARSKLISFPDSPHPGAGPRAPPGQLAHHRRRPVAGANLGMTAGPGLVYASEVLGAHAGRVIAPSGGGLPAALERRPFFGSQVPAATTEGMSFSPGSWCASRGRIARPARNAIRDLGAITQARTCGTRRLGRTSDGGVTSGT